MPCAAPYQGLPTSCAAASRRRRGDLGVDPCCADAVRCADARCCTDARSCADAMGCAGVRHRCHGVPWRHMSFADDRCHSARCCRGLPGAMGCADARVVGRGGCSRCSSLAVRLPGRARGRPSSPGRRRWARARVGGPMAGGAAPGRRPRRAGRDGRRYRGGSSRPPHRQPGRRSASDRHRPHPDRPRIGAGPPRGWPPRVLGAAAGARGGGERGRGYRVTASTGPLGGTAPGPLRRTQSDEARDADSVLGIPTIVGRRQGPSGNIGS